jgi:hypothetical protein
MEASIELINLLLHALRRLQPLDIRIFRLLKRNLTKHLERRLRNDSRRIQRVEWIEAFIAARQDSFRVSSLESSFRSAGIYLFDPSEVLPKIDPPPCSTPPPRNGPSNLNATLLGGSLPEGTDFR